MPGPNTGDLPSTGGTVTNYTASFSADTYVNIGSMDVMATGDDCHGEGRSHATNVSLFEGTPGSSSAAPTSIGTTTVARRT
jgi:hypothetical protein